METLVSVCLWGKRIGTYYRLLFLLCFCNPNRMALTHHPLLAISMTHVERILTYNEKPLLLMKQLKENKESPVFMLKHIKQMKSPAVNTPTPPNALPPRKDLMNKELPVPPYNMNMAASASQVTLVASSGASISSNLSAQTNGSSASTLGRSGTFHLDNASLEEITGDQHDFGDCLSS